MNRIAKPKKKEKNRKKKRREIEVESRKTNMLLITRALEYMNRRGYRRGVGRHYRTLESETNLKAIPRSSFHLIWSHRLEQNVLGFGPDRSTKTWWLKRLNTSWHLSRLLDSIYTNGIFKGVRRDIPVDILSPGRACTPMSAVFEINEYFGRS